MALTPLYDSVVSEDTSNRLVALDGSTVEVLLRSDNSQAALFDDEDGISPAANPVTVDDSGRFACWVEEGQYNLSVTTPSGATSVHPVDLGGGGGVDDTAEGVVHKAEEETVTGKKVFSPTTVSPGISLEPVTDGYFQDFNVGATGVIPRIHDPGTPHWFDAITIGTNASCVYAQDSLLSPLPGSIKITTSASDTVLLTWNAAAYRDLPDHYGRFYVYLDTAPGAAFQVLTWLTVGGAGTFKLRVNTNRTIDLQNNAGTTLGTTAALTAATWYRVEWHLVHSTTVGSATVKLFQGHSTTATSTITVTGIDTGTLSAAIKHGVNTAANLGGNYFRVAALAGGCIGWPGPYADTAANLEVVTPDSKSLAEWLPGGQMILRSTDEYGVQVGPLPKYKVQRGDTIFRTHPMGLMMGANLNVGNPMSLLDTDLTDIYIDLASRRIQARSYNLRILNDPPDIHFERMNDPSEGADPNTPWLNMNDSYFRVGTSATWSTTSKTVTILASEAAFSLKDRGHGLRLGGTTYNTSGIAVNIAEVTGPQTVTLTSFPTTNSEATTATGVNALNSATINCGSTSGFATPEHSTTATGVNALNSGTINCGSTTGFAAYGYAYLGGVRFWYGAKTGSSFTGCGPHAATTGGEVIAYNLCTAYLGGTAFTYTGVTATSFTGCGSHAATTGGEAITYGVWKLIGAPYPEYTIGVNTGGTIGQLRFGPHMHPYMGKSTAGMGTVINTEGVAVAFTGGTYTWTSADVGRHLLINDDPTIVGSGLGSFTIEGVNSTTVTGAHAGGATLTVASTAGFADSGKVQVNLVDAVTYTGRTATTFTGCTGIGTYAGDEVVQGLKTATQVLATLVNASYRVAGGKHDDGDQSVQAPVDLVVDLNVDACHFGDSLPAAQVASGTLEVHMIPKDILYINTTGGGYTATRPETMFQVTSEGGFGHGWGSTVTQLTSKSTGVTINTPCGKITTHGATLNASTSVSFTVTCGSVDEDDVVIVSIASGATAAAYQVCVDSVTASGTFRVHLRNTSAGNLAETLVLNYSIIKGRDRGNN